MSQSRAYIACVPHVPLITMQDRAQNPLLWRAYEARIAEFEAFDPEIVIVFGGNHYQGVHLNMAPTFMVGQIAEAVDDCGGTPGRLDIPMEASVVLAAALVEDGFDIATSYAMVIDHGFSNVRGNFLGGRLDVRPVIPVHINSLTFPRPTMKRFRQLGDAVGRFVATLGKRVAFLGSGGLSHQTDFIFPQYDTAPSEDVRTFIVHGGGTGTISRQTWMDDIRHGMDGLSGQLTEGSFTALWINSAWYESFLDLFRAGDLTVFDGWADADVIDHVGYGGGEIRMWIAAAAAGLAAGAPGLSVDYYSANDKIAVGAAVAHSTANTASAVMADRDADMPLVVLLHGWGGSFAATYGRCGWPEALPAAGRDVVAVDLPGHGGPASGDPESYADLASALAERLPRERVDVVGYSLGGKLALALAARAPERFRRIIIGGVGDNLFAPEPQGEALAATLEHGVDADTPAEIADLVRYAQAGGGDPLALAAILRRPPNPLFDEADLGSIGDVLLVNGDADRIALPDGRLRAALKGCPYVSCPEIDHAALPSTYAFQSAAVAFLGGGAEPPALAAPFTQQETA